MRAATSAGLCDTGENRHTIGRATREPDMNRLSFSSSAVLTHRDDGRPWR
jgi:hypothetical protein